MFAVCVASVTGRAEEPPTEAKTDGGAAPAAAPPTTTPPPTTTKDEFNFELGLPGAQKPGVVQSEAEKLRLQRLENRVHLRRRMLLSHQIFGFITIGALAVTNIIGALLYYDKFSGTDTQEFQPAHLGLGIATSVVFATTASLALFAPNPYPKPIKFDTALVHKASMAVAAACFVAQLIMGPIASNAEGQLYEKDLALAHNVIGWTALGFMIAGTVAYMIK
jgi:hypothetical protein